MFRNVNCLSDFLCKSLLKPSAWKRYWQRQHKEYVETWGQTWDITRVIQRHCKDNKKTKRTNEDKPRTSRGQKKDLKRAAPTESTTLPEFDQAKTSANFFRTKKITYFQTKLQKNQKKFWAKRRPFPGNSDKEGSRLLYNTQIKNNRDRCEFKDVWELCGSRWPALCQDKLCIVLIQFF